MALAICLVMPCAAYSQTLTAVWDPSDDEEETTSYNVCLGTVSWWCNLGLASVPASQTSYSFTPSPGILYHVAVRAVGSTGAGAFSPEITFSIPSVNLPANQLSAVNSPISPVSVTASDPDRGTVRFTHSGLPHGLTLNASTGLITGSPASAGTYTVTIFASDDLATTSRSFTWTVFGLSTDSVTPGAGSGSSQTFTARYSNTLGASDLTLVYLRFSTGPTGPTNTCMVRYDRAAGRLSLRDDGGNWMAGAHIPASGVQQNSQCAIDFAGSSASSSGQTLTLNVAVTFRSSYAGTKNIYGYATSATGAIADWQHRGTWTIPSTGGSGSSSSSSSGSGSGSGAVGSGTSGGPASSQIVTVLTAGTVFPNAGSGSAQTFSAQYSDPRSVSNLTYVYLRVSGTPNGPANSCMVRYSPVTGRFWFRDDWGAWGGGYRFYHGGTWANSQCAIDVGRSSASVSGQTVTLNVAITFRPSYSGAKNIYLYAQDAAGLVTDWQQRGTWFIP
jgi:hypothetical protein